VRAVAVTNAKGGTGKTTTAVNVAAALGSVVNGCALWILTRRAAPPGGWVPTHRAAGCSTCSPALPTLPAGRAVVGAGG